MATALARLSNATRIGAPWRKTSASTTSEVSAGSASATPAMRAERSRPPASIQITRLPPNIEIALASSASRPGSLASVSAESRTTWNGSPTSSTSVGTSRRARSLTRSESVPCSRNIAARRRRLAEERLELLAFDDRQADAPGNALFR